MRTLTSYVCNLGALACLVCGLSACDGGERLFFKQEASQITGDSEVLVTSACEELPWGHDGRASTGAVGPGQAFQVVHTLKDDTVHVAILDRDGQPVASREYTRDELRSQDPDEVQVSFEGEGTIRFRFWGGKDCSDVHFPE